MSSGRSKTGARKGRQEASGLEALLSLASAAEYNPDSSKSKSKARFKTRVPVNQVGAKGQKRSRTYNTNTQRRITLSRQGSKRKYRAQDHSTSNSGVTEGPGYCAVGNAPPLLKAKNSTRHAAIAYFIYYQQRKSMMKCIGPEGQPPLSLDPTLEARLLKERTEWMKRTDPEPHVEVNPDGTKAPRHYRLDYPAGTVNKRRDHPSAVTQARNARGVKAYDYENRGFNSQSHNPDSWRAETYYESKMTEDPYYGRGRMERKIPPPPPPPPLLSTSSTDVRGTVRSNGRLGERQQLRQNEAQAYTTRTQKQMYQQAQLDSMQSSRMY
mmetsp:Transcript_16550/g.40760  ORF Transcript_16550/g.40760 Transcript_16550/m.40760 type:complete len:325 (+) Transcript_16550:359-1333(+)